MNFHKKRKSMKSCKLLRNDINVLFVLLTRLIFENAFRWLKKKRKATEIRLR